MVSTATTVAAAAVWYLYATTIDYVANTGTWTLLGSAYSTDIACRSACSSSADCMVYNLYTYTHPVSNVLSVGCYTSTTLPILAVPSSPVNPGNVIGLKLATPYTFNNFDSVAIQNLFSPKGVVPSTSYYSCFTLPNADGMTEDPSSTCGVPLQDATVSRAYDGSICHSPGSPINIQPGFFSCVALQPTSCLGGYRFKSKVGTTLTGCSQCISISPGTPYSPGGTGTICYTCPDASVCSPVTGLVVSCKGARNAYYAATSTQAAYCVVCPNSLAFIDNNSPCAVQVGAITSGPGTVDHCQAGYGFNKINGNIPASCSVCTSPSAPGTCSTGNSGSCILGTFSLGFSPCTTCGSKLVSQCASSKASLVLQCAPSYNFIPTNGVIPSTCSACPGAKVVDSSGACNAPVGSKVLTTDTSLIVSCNAGYGYYAATSTGTVYIVKTLASCIQCTPSSFPNILGTWSDGTAPCAQCSDGSFCLNTQKPDVVACAANYGYFTSKSAPASCSLCTGAFLNTDSIGQGPCSCPSSSLCDSNSLVSSCKPGLGNGFVASVLGGALAYCSACTPVSTTNPLGTASLGGTSPCLPCTGIYRYIASSIAGVCKSTSDPTVISCPAGNSFNTAKPGAPATCSACGTDSWAPAGITASCYNCALGVTGTPSNVATCDSTTGAPLTCAAGYGFSATGNPCSICSGSGSNAWSAGGSVACSPCPQAGSCDPKTGNCLPGFGKYPTGCLSCAAGSTYNTNGVGVCTNCAINTVCGPISPSATSCTNNLYGLTPAVAPSVLATCNRCPGDFVASLPTSACSCPTIARCDSVTNLVTSCIGGNGFYKISGSIPGHCIACSKPDRTFSFGALPCSPCQTYSYCDVSSGMPTSCLIGTGFPPTLPRIGGCHPCDAGFYASTGNEPSCQVCSQLALQSSHANGCDPNTGFSSSCVPAFGLVNPGTTTATCNQCSSTQYSPGGLGVACASCASNSRCGPISSTVTGCNNPQFGFDQVNKNCYSCFSGYPIIFTGTSRDYVAACPCPDKSTCSSNPTTITSCVRGYGLYNGLCSQCSGNTFSRSGGLTCSKCTDSGYGVATCDSFGNPLTCVAGLAVQNGACSVCGPQYATWSDGTGCRPCTGSNAFCDPATGITTSCSSLNYGFYNGVCIACLSYFNNYFHANTGTSPCNCPVGGHCGLNSNNVFIINYCDPGFANSGQTCVPCGAGTWSSSGAAPQICQTCIGIMDGSTLTCNNQNGNALTCYTSRVYPRNNYHLSSKNKCVPAYCSWQPISFPGCDPWI